MIKSQKDIHYMRIAGKLTADVLDMITPYVTPGRSTEELDLICHQYMQKHGAIPAPLELDFPKAVCISVNDEVCHGIPNHRILKSTDMVNIDVSLNKDHYYGDSSKMFVLPDAPEIAHQLTHATQASLYEAIRWIKPGVRLGDIGCIITSYAHQRGFSVVREYCGHGIGMSLHEDPQVLHYAQKDTGMKLKPGMTFTIEPMINAGKRFVHSLSDGWTVVTIDGKLSAQWEHTLLITAHGCEVLTQRAEENIFK